MGTDSTLKRKYMIVYDYGMGAISRIVNAHSAKEIEDKFPQLTVYDYRQLPEWATPEWMLKLEAKGIYDIDTILSDEFFKGLSKHKID